jgi:hypothetical protein
MKKTNYIFTIITLFILLLNGCSNNLEEEQGSLVDKDSLNNNELIKNKIIKTEHFRLNSIFGTFAPHGGLYEYDSKQKKWCERPMAADMLAYASQNNIEDSEKVEDLSDYFDEKTSNMINTCILSVETREKNKIIRLRFGGDLIFEDSVNLQTRSIKISKLLKNFIGETPGSMYLSEGSNYLISINQPSINYSNEVGDYELNFSKITTEKISIVTKEKAYFYQDPLIESKEKVYIVKTQNVFIEKFTDKFVYVKFINGEGIITRGWLLKSDLSLSVQD